MLFPPHKDMEERKTYTANQEQLARFAKAIGHPARVAILEFLARQSVCYFGDIHEELPIAKATVSQHLKELKDAGLIQGEILIAASCVYTSAAFHSIITQHTEPTPLCVE